MKKQFDFVIMDTPPVLPATDAMILAPQTDGVLLVIRENHSTREMIQKTIDQINHSQAKLVGVVLNDVDVKRGRYYSNKYYSKYYSRYYGEKP